MKNTFSLGLIFIVIAFAGCQKKYSAQNAKEELMKADAAFSELSAAKGVHESFLTYMDDKAVLLRPNGYPLEGKEAVRQQYNKKSDKGLRLTWKPAFANVSESGELGYTYGIWELKFTGADGKEQTEKGTYATVWERDSAGKWKVVLDVGNEGLEPKKEE